MESKCKSVLCNSYDKTTDGGVCKPCKCNDKTSDNTTNMKNHIKRKHPSINVVNMSKIAKSSMSSTSLETDETAADVDDPAETETNVAIMPNQIVVSVSLINE